MKIQEFKVGQKITMYNIDSCLAMTHKKEIIITKSIPSECNYKMKGKRTEFMFRVKDQAIFEGCNQPILCDTDDTAPSDASGSKIMRGNAYYNFIGDKNVVKDWIEKYQLNQAFEKERVLAIQNGEEVVVYPELYNGGHAVIGNLLQKGGIE